VSRFFEEQAEEGSGDESDEAGGRKRSKIDKAAHYYDRKDLARKHDWRTGIDRMENQLEEKERRRAQK
jgi:hypothetical protein|tara:strand:- start:531 stop:734 length:204 start_codon:yes stop_codon:yes gene_type:complete